MATSDCEKVLELLNEYFDGELDENSAKFVRSHIEACESCRAAFDQLKRLGEIFEEEKQSVPDELYDRIMDEVRREKPTVRKSFIMRKWGIVAVAAVICLSVLSTPTLIMLISGGTRAEASDSALKADMEMSNQIVESFADKSQISKPENGSPLYSDSAGGAIEAPTEEAENSVECDDCNGILRVTVDSGTYTAYMLDGSKTQLAVNTENNTARLGNTDYLLEFSGELYVIKNGTVISFRLVNDDVPYFKQVND